MPKHLRKQDRLQSMPMVVKPAVETPMDLKKAVVKELICEGKVVVHKKKRLNRLKLFSF